MALLGGKTGATIALREIQFTKPVDCNHYLRRCALYAPCCGKVYKCRFCHDQTEEHQLDRKLVTELQCLQCNTRQKLATHCQECSIKFGFYSCLDCCLFDDRDKGQFHCPKCKLCRVGGQENFFHCDNCQICLSVNLKECHKCRPDRPEEKCPVCLDFIYTASQPSIVPQCGHLIHESCYKTIQFHGYRNCPYCTVQYSTPKSDQIQKTKI